jgi:hypothetical protein
MLGVGWIALLLAFVVLAEQPAAEASPASTDTIVPSSEAPHDEDDLLLMTVAVGISGSIAGLLALVVVARRPALSPGPPSPARCPLEPPSSRAPPLSS